MTKQTAWIFPIILTLLVFSLGTGRAENETLSGLDIMKKVDTANMTMDQTSLVTMILIDAQGNERKIETLRYHKHYGGKKDLDNKSVFFTEFPPDQKGIGFLIWDYAIEGQPDDLWLYLPALRTVRRMTTRDQHDSFMGSDLTFADMGARRLDEDDHRLVQIDPRVCPGEPCYVVDSYPKEKDSPYGFKRFFISKKNWVALKIEFYDRKKKPLKLQTIEWQQIDDVLVWKSSNIRNVQTNHRTIFEISKVKNNTGLVDADFSERMLERGGRR